VPRKQRRQELAMESTQKKSSNSRVHRSDRIKPIFGVVSLFSSGLSSQHQQKSAPVAVSQESLLAAQERGYQTVLQREPQNQTALEGLANVRLQMNNKVGAIEPLEKLVKLNPDRADYKALLEQAKGK
jgi:cytochrome c-type biogenesis protein CcmH/NrfG